MNIQLSAQTSWPAAVALSGTYCIHIYKVLHINGHILYRYCSLDDSVGNAIVGIYKMIFIFIKLENDNSNKQQRPLPSPVSAPGTAPTSPLLSSPPLSLLRLLPQADQFPASVSRICSVTAIKTVLWYCPDYIARASVRALPGGRGEVRGRGSLPGQWTTVKCFEVYSQSCAWSLPAQNEYMNVKWTQLVSVVCLPYCLYVCPLAGSVANVLVIPTRAA